jgi:hypothetical protein
MNVSDFVKDTFEQIIDGVKRAKAAGGNAEGIAAVQRFKIASLPDSLIQDSSGAIHTIVDFDLAVTEGSSFEGKTGVSVVAFNAGGSGTKESQTVSRVKFSIPITFR